MKINIVKLGTICKIIIGKTPSTKIEKNWVKLNGYNWLTITDILNNNYSTNKKISEFAINKYRLHSTDDNSLLFCFIGTLEIRTFNKGYYYNQAIADIQVNKNLVLKEYLMHYLASQLYLYNLKYKNSILPCLSYKTISNLDIPLIDLNAQYDFLNKIQKFDLDISKFHNMLNKINKIKFQLLNYFFNSIQGDNVKLEKVIRTYSGKLISRIYMQNNAGEYPVYSSATKNNGLYGKINSYMFDGEYGVYTARGYAGNLFYHNEKFNLASNAFAWNIKNKLTIFRYVFYYLLWKENIIKGKINTGTAIKMFKQKDLLNFEIILPSLNSQIKIVNNINNLYDKLNLLTEKINIFLTEYKNFKNKIVVYLICNSSNSW